MDRKLLSIELGRMSAEQYKSKPQSGVAVILDNVRSAHNTGSALRSADCFGVDFVALCGITATPPSTEIHKAALGAEDSVPWKHYPDTMQAVNDLRAQGYRIVAVEQTEKAVELQDLDVSGKIALIFGNEVDGVQQEVVDSADLSTVIPQFGTKHSLNVSVCAGVTLWEVIKRKVAQPRVSRGCAT